MVIPFEGCERAVNDFPWTFDVMLEGKKYSIILRRGDLARTNCSQTTKSTVICSLAIYTKQFQSNSLRNILIPFSLGWVLAANKSPQIFLLELHFSTETLKDFEIPSAWMWFLSYMHITLMLHLGNCVC